MYTTSANTQADIFSMSGIATTGTDGMRRVTLTPDTADRNMVTITRNPNAALSGRFRGVSGSFICNATMPCTFTVQLANQEMDQITAREPRVLASNDPFVYTVDTGRDDGWIFEAGLTTPNCHSGWGSGIHGFWLVDKNTKER